MNKILTILMIFLLIIGLSPIYAQETETESNEGGVTPDSALYGLDRAAEKLSLLLTINKADKAKKGLEHARERVLEAKQSIKKGKVENLEKLKEEHKKTLEKVKKNLDTISEQSPEKALDRELEVEAEIENQVNEIEEAETEIDLKLAGKLNAEQLAKLKDFLQSLNTDVSEARVKVKENKEKVKIRIKQELKKTDEEVEQKTNELKEKHKVEEIKEKHAQKAVERLEEKLAKLTDITNKHRERGKDVSAMDARLSEVKEILEKLKINLVNNELDSVRELIKRADQLLNFREVFKALEDNNDQKLKELDREKELKKKELELKIKELEKRKEDRKNEKELEKAKKEQETEKENEELETKGSEKADEKSNSGKGKEE